MAEWGKSKIMNLDDLFVSIREKIFSLIYQKNIDLNSLIFDLRTDKATFIDFFSHRNDNFFFYLQTLSLVENWEG